MFHVGFLEDPATQGPLLALMLGLMALECLISWLTRRIALTHDLKEAAASFAVAAGRNIFKALDAAVVTVPLTILYQHRLLTFDPWSPAAIAATFLATEFSYYWYHRAAHRVRWLWATHVVHHTPLKLNFTAAIRLGWTGTFSGNFLFFLPLPLLGFHPLAIAAAMGLNLAYQFFIHTEVSPRLGPLEWVINTPTHHRVHHASDDAYLDKNYGGTLIVFDRLFGTFAAAPRHETLTYSVVGGPQTFNPLRLVFGEWLTMGRDAWSAPGLRAKIHALFGPPSAKVAGAEAPRTGATDLMVLSSTQGTAFTGEQTELWEKRRAGAANVG